MQPEVVDGMKFALTARHAGLAEAAQAKDVKTGGSKAWR